MAKESAGILLYRQRGGATEVFLIHPGGPFWKKKDEGAWSIPKGEANEGEDRLAAAIREFAEETGTTVAGDFQALSPIKQAGGKWVYAWALAGDLDPATLTSNEFEMEWPLRSGKRVRFPEVDRGAWFALAEARSKINKGQAALLDALTELRPEPAATKPARLCLGRKALEVSMSDHVYSITEIVGSSGSSVDDAIKTGIATAAKTLRNLEWFEVTQIRGHLDNGKIAHYQVQMKLGLRYETK
jgi:predicted NUDIX family NTP pyrophosphohydrolase/flavin-binding protein dodecin